MKERASDCENGDDIWNAFHSKLIQLIDSFVPKKRKYFAINHSSRLYYSKKISELQSHKLLCWRKYKRFKTTECKVRYNEASRTYRQAIVDHVRNKEEAVINSNNLGKFFNLANRKFASKSGIGPLQSVNGVYCTDPAEKAAILGDFFSSVFTEDDDSMPKPAVNSSLFQDGLNNIVFDRMRVLKVMNKLKVGSAGGPDNLKPRFLKFLANELSGPLAYIFEILISIWMRSVFMESGTHQTCVQEGRFVLGVKLQTRVIDIGMLQVDGICYKGSNDGLSVENEVYIKTPTWIFNETFNMHPASGMCSGLVRNFEKQAFYGCPVCRLLQSI